MSEVLTHFQGSHNPEANEWVLSWLRRLCAGARVLDFASGAGRHARAACELGLSVEAWDQDASALQSLDLWSKGRVKTVACDLETQPWPVLPGKVDALIVTNYLFRGRMAFLPDLVRPGGLVLYQTFAEGHELLGRPRRREFLLQAGELLDWARSAGMHVLAFEDGVTTGADGQPAARVQRIAALAAGGRGPGLQALAPWPVKIR